MSHRVVSETIVPFGKHKGKSLIDVEEKYLKWMAQAFPPTSKWAKLAKLALDHHRQTSSSNKLGDVVLQFGKHKGKALKEVPKSYLSWMAIKMAGENVGVTAQRFLDGCNMDIIPDLAPDERQQMFRSTGLIQKMGSTGEVKQAKALFDDMPRTDAAAWNAMITCYGQNGYIAEAKECFDAMPCDKTKFSWFALFGAYHRKDLVEEATELFHQMPRRDQMVWITLLRLHSQKLDMLKKIFQIMPFHDLTSSTLILSAYSSHEYFEEAKNLFDKMPERDSVSWNAMLAAYANSGHGSEAHELFKLAPHWNRSICLSIIKVYAEDYMLQNAESLFHSMLQCDIVSWTKFMDVCARCGDMEKANEVFRLMPATDIVAWTVMLGGYAGRNMLNEAKLIFEEMPEKDTHAYTIFLMACAEESGNVKEKDMEAFMDMAEADTVAWNSLLAANARDGQLQLVAKVFESMQLQGASADSISFVCILQACSHNAKVQLGRDFFRSMGLDYGIGAERKHYCCMVDLLARSGHLDDAEELISSMPFHPSAAEWNALLGACRNQKKEGSDRAERAAKHLMELRNEASYVLLGNVYANRRVDLVDCNSHPVNVDMALESLRESMRQRGFRRKPGISTVNFGKGTYTFVVGDNHPEINAELERLTGLLRAAGYKPKTEVSFCGGDQKEKEELLCQHSEKLALAFGLLSTQEGGDEIIRITKNLRMCYDCHDATRVISGLVKRKIVVKDANRLHRFENGMCSCGDFW
ncbi:pentatricopeptide repeat-containing protein ELI1, chloroplastic-like [Selaginella moellendorffii]|uniref:pentatricopeptide repeat-containing protein ELI1, chloroplastic-like n=1 Tax=Selaginella moellendorffii TaxID=88036 RepID=UPI000D1CFE58|nr:pentatricopeptide repeat-containing protein ELI1, chloroplastic-like [Selaginella moellendorffii]|eukprot:XP_024516766.1 pentatricopeptide repeat-containing protein ELI1, chloroplastic-like [Selaginella moellendorffii]